MFQDLQDVGANTLNRFLQSRESNVPLEETQILYDQGLATASCLLSGFQTFKKDGSTAEQKLRVVRGLHGLHLYASEYWVEYLLDIAASDDGLKTTTAFFARSNSLAQIINSSSSNFNLESNTDEIDSRLANLEEHGELWTAARSATSGRAKMTVSPEKSTG